MNVAEIFNKMDNEYDEIRDLWYAWLFSRLHYSIAKDIINTYDPKIVLDMLYKIFYSQIYKLQQHQLSGLPPALKGARKSECAPTRKNSPSGRLA